MTEDRWLDIVAMVKDRFSDVEEGNEALPEEEGPGTVAWIAFEGPAGRTKLTRTTRPLVLDKKTFGSRRIGGQTGVEYVYSETETTHSFAAWKWDDETQTWKKLALEADQLSW